MESSPWFGVYFHCTFRRSANQPKKVNWELSLTEGHKTKVPRCKLMYYITGRNWNMCFFRCNNLTAYMIES